MKERMICMKKMLISLMLAGAMCAASLPVQAADAAGTVGTAETTATTVADAPSEALQMSLNFNTIDWMLGTPLYLDGITACVFSQKNGYILENEPITNEKYFKFDTFEVDNADRPGTYNVYVAYNDQSVDLYTILHVNLYAETASAETTGFNPVGTVLVTTTSSPVWTGGTVQTTIDPTPDTEITWETTAVTDAPDDVMTGMTMDTTKHTYRTTLPTTETTTGTQFGPVGTVVSTGTTARPQETTAVFTTNLYTNEDGIVCYEYYANIGDTITVDEAYIGLPCIAYEEHASYENGIITAKSAGEFYIIFCTSETFFEQVARMDVTILPDPNATTADSDEPEQTNTTTVKTRHTTVTTTTAYTDNGAFGSDSRPEPTATTATTLYDCTTVVTTITNAPSTTTTAAHTEIAPETTKPDGTTGTISAGDVNADGEISILDVLILSKHLLTGSALDARAVKSADVDRSGTPDFSDVLLILKRTVALITEF